VGAHHSVVRRQTTRGAVGEKPSSSRRERLSGFDGLRAIAALIVVSSHILVIGFPPGFFHGLPSLFTNALTAGAGSGIFFALSGFFNTGSLLSRRDRTATLGAFYRHFWTRRGLRIFPLYFVFLLMVFAAGSQSPSEIPWMVYAAMLQNWYIGLGYEPRTMTVFTWSLAVDTQFFLLWPAVVWFCTRNRLKWGALAIFIVSVPIRYYVLIHYGSVAAYTFLCTRMGGLALGGLACVLVQEKHVLATRIIPRVTPYFLTVAVLLMGSGTMGRGDFFPTVVGYPYLAVTWTFLVVTVRQQSPALIGALEWWPLKTVGLASYGVYLLHAIALSLVVGTMLRIGIYAGDSWAVMAMYPLLVCGLTAVLVCIARPFEKWCISWEDRLAP